MNDEKNVIGARLSVPKNDPSELTMVTIVDISEGMFGLKERLADMAKSMDSRLASNGFVFPRETDEKMKEPSDMLEAMENSLLELRNLATILEQQHEVIKRRLLC